MKRVILGLSVLIGAASAACASVTAKTPPERPALEVPAPPAKVVEPPPRPEPPPEPVPDLPAPQPSNSRPARQPAREPARTDPKPETTTEAAPPPAPVAAPPQLRLPNSPEASEAAKQVQIVIEHAGKSLDSVNPKGFPKARRAVYDDAKRMLTQAQEALKKTDFDNARKLAEKVEQTAKELGAR